MHESFVVRLSQIKVTKGRNVDMIARFTLQQGEILSKVATAQGKEHGAQDPCFKLEWETPFYVFLRPFNKSIIKDTMKAYFC